MIFDEPTQPTLKNGLNNFDHQRKNELHFGGWWGLPPSSKNAWFRCLFDSFLRHAWMAKNEEAKLSEQERQSQYVVVVNMNLK